MSKEDRQQLPEGVRIKAEQTHLTKATNKVSCKTGDVAGKTVENTLGKGAVGYGTGTASGGLRSTLEGKPVSEVLEDASRQGLGPKTGGMIVGALGGSWKGFYDVKNMPKDQKIEGAESKGIHVISRIWNFAFGYGERVNEIVKEYSPEDNKSLLAHVNEGIEFYKSVGAMVELTQALISGNIIAEDLLHILGNNVKEALIGDILYIKDNAHLFSPNANLTKEQARELGRRTAGAIWQLEKIGYTIYSLGRAIKGYLTAKLAVRNGISPQGTGKGNGSSLGEMSPADSARYERLWNDVAGKQGLSNRAYYNALEDQFYVDRFTAGYYNGFDYSAWESTWIEGAGKVPKDAVNVPETVGKISESAESRLPKKVNTYDLEPNQNLHMGRNKFNKFVEEIKTNGIKEPIKYVEYNGKKYVVDGHHRLLAAKTLGIKEIPVQEVQLPYAGYKTIVDLLNWGD